VAIGALLVALALGTLAGAISRLVRSEKPGSTIPGIVISVRCRRRKIF
jgi:hypothetical protein